MNRCNSFGRSDCQNIERAVQAVAVTMRPDRQRGQSNGTFVVAESKYFQFAHLFRLERQQFKG